MPLSTGFVGRKYVVQIIREEWRSAVQKSFGTLSKIIFRLVPHAKETHDLWTTTHGRNLIIDIETVEMQGKMPYDVHWFVARQKKLATDRRYTTKKGGRKERDELFYFLSFPSRNLYMFGVEMHNTGRSVKHDHIVWEYSTNSRIFKEFSATFVLKRFLGIDTEALMIPPK